MDTQEAYHELGLDPSASDAELKASWRRLVAQWHPDRNAAADAGRRMQHINKAYQHIRQLRDGGAADEDAGAAAAPPHAHDRDHGHGHEDPPHPNTHCRTIALTLEEAILGCTRTLSGHFTLACDVCAGKGQRVLAKACPTCQGSGAVRRAALFGWLWSEESCTDCGGDGRQRAPCDACDGQGEQRISYRRRVRFPAGVRAGHVLSVQPPRQAGRALVLELQVEIAPHPLFVLDADGVLRCEMPVNGYAWMAGRWVEVPTPDGLQQMRLNRNAQVYRLAGQGFPQTLRGPRGDYMVKVVPQFPAQPDPAQEALLEQLIAASSQTAASDPAQPLGQWQGRLASWQRSHKEPAADA